jgi:hypothetical protein
MMRVSLNSYGPAGTIRCAQCQILSLPLPLPYRLSVSLSLSLSWCLACKSVLCSSDVSILFLSSALASMKERKREQDAPSHAREARSLTNDETIAVLLHTKLACCFYWCYSIVAKRDVTPRQLRQCAR